MIKLHISTTLYLNEHFQSAVQTDERRKVKLLFDKVAQHQKLLSCVHYVINQNENIHQNKT